VLGLIGRLADLQGVQQQQQCMGCPMSFFSLQHTADSVPAGTSNQSLLSKLMQ